MEEAVDSEAVEAFGSLPEISPDSQVHRIILWSQEGVWTFIAAPADWTHDAEVTEAWMKDFYSTTQTRQQELLTALAKEVGINEGS